MLEIVWISFKTRSDVAIASLKLAMWPRITQNASLPCLHLPSAGITGMLHFVCLLDHFLKDALYPDILYQKGAIILFRQGLIM